MSDTTKNQTVIDIPIDPHTPRQNLHASGLRSIIQEFSLNTSTHGIPGIARSASVHNRFYWSIVFLLFTGIMIYFVTQSITAYFQYSTQTTTETINQWPQAFPAVTICNYSPLRYDRFIGPYLNFTNTYNVTDKHTFSSEHTQHIQDFLQHKLNHDEPLDEFYFSLDSMLIKCVYNGGNCSSADFVKFISPVYGRCYTFNAQSNQINDGQLHYNNENGHSGRLELSLFAHSHQYVPFYSDGVGMVVMLHNNTQLPLVDRVSTHLVPGRKHKIGYTKRTNIFLPSPYSMCKEKVTPGMQAMFNQFSSADYTFDEEICFQVALQTYTYQQCGCVSPFQWAARYVVLPNTGQILRAALCNISDACYSEAARRFQTTSSIVSEVAKDCDLQCTSIEFVMQLSSVSAPPEWLMDDIRGFVESSSIPLPVNWSTTWQADIQSNYIGIDVVCESTRMTSFKQQAAIGAVDLLSNVGGQTGLWIGISFLSLMEVIEMLYRVVRHLWYHTRLRIGRET